MKSLKSFIISEQSEYYSADSDTERRAGVPSWNVKTFKKSTDFKREISKLVITKEVKPLLSDGPVVIKGGSSANVYITSRKDFDQQNVETVLQPMFDKFEKIHNVKLYVVQFSPNKFIITSQPDDQ